MAAAAARGGTALAAPSGHVHPSRRCRRCGVCGRTYEGDAWNGLAVLGTLPPASVQPHLSVAAAWAIDLRSCVCGAVLAARRPVDSPPVDSPP